MGPGSIGISKKKDSSKVEKKSAYGTAIFSKNQQNILSKINPICLHTHIVEKQQQTKDIWNTDEVEEGAEFDTVDDPRMQPDYDIIYKQKLTSEELFLQMGNKTNATSSCEDMVVKIHLPGVGKISEIDVNVVENFLDCRTSK